MYVLYYLSLTATYAFSPNGISTEINGNTLNTYRVNSELNVNIDMHHEAFLYDMTYQRTS